MSRLRWMFPCSAVFLLFCAGTSPAQEGAPRFRPDYTALLAPAEMQSRLVRRFQAFEQSVDDPARLLRDKTLFDEWTEVRWALQRTSDYRQVNAALSRQGIGLSAEGYFRINLREFPQWHALDEDLRTLRKSAALLLHRHELEQRGFTSTDFVQLEQALEGLDPLQSAEQDRIELFRQYAAQVKANPVSAVRFDHPSASALAYQSYLISMEAQRRWAVGVLDKLSKRQERILLSFLLEQEAYVTYAPDQGYEARLRETQEAVTSGLYVELLKQKEQRK